MKKIQRNILFFLTVAILSCSFIMSAAAQGLLPSGEATEEGQQSCEELFAPGNTPDPAVLKAFENAEGFETYFANLSAGQSKQENLRWILGCAIKSGKIHLYMIPFFITFIVQFALSVAGLISVLFLVLGGYYYVIGGISEEQEKGKKTIQNALIGLIVSLSAWIIVNFVQVALTS